MIAAKDELHLVFIVAAIAVVCTVALSFSSALPIVIATICGALLLGVAPGYAWSYAIFPFKKIPTPQRFLISVPLSIAITATCAFIMSAYLHVSLTAMTLKLVLLAIVLAGSGFALYIHKTAQ